MHFKKNFLGHSSRRLSETQFEKDSNDSSKEKTLAPDSVHGEKSLSASRAYFRLWSYASPLDWVFRTIAALAAMGGGTAYPLMTIIFGSLINDFNAIALGLESPAKFRASVNRNSLLFVYLFIGKFGLLYIADFFFCFTATRMARQIRLAYLKRVLHQPISYFDSHTSGSIATSLSTDTNMIEVGLADKLASVLQAAGMIIGAFAIAFTKSWKMTLVVGTTIPYILITTMILGSLDSLFETKQREKYSVASKIAEEALSSVSSITALGAKNKIIANYSVPLAKASRLGMRIGPVQATMYGNMFFSMQSAYALALYYGVKLASRGEIKDGGTVMVVLFCMMLGSSAMGIASPTIPAFLKAAASAQQVLNALGKEPKNGGFYGESSGLQLRAEDVRGRLSVKNLTFCYPERPTVTVLDDLSLEIPAEKTTAIVGHSGSGKSTIIGLLERWYRPSEGCIYLDGTDIEQLGTSSLRGQIGLVQQDPMLFNDTIFQNILNGYHGGHVDKLSEEEKQKKVVRASIQANAHEFIEKLPEGYNTIVGERASLLSGGQRQRIAIARSIISNPKILLLDEATSALDSESERAVQAALERASHGRTTLIIAHKLSTIENADKIVVMDKGQIVEEGTHSELLEADGAYCRLLHAQSLAPSEGEETPAGAEEVEVPLLKEVSSQVKPLADRHIEQPLNLDSKTISRRLNILRCAFIILRDTKIVLPAIFGGTAGACVAGAAIPMQAFLFSKLVTVFQLTGGHRTERANFWAAMFFTLALANITSYAILWFLFSIAGSTISKKYRSRYLKDLLSQDMEFFEVVGNSSGALTALLSTDGDDLEMFFSMGLALMMVFGIDIFACGILAIAMGWRLGLVGVFGCFPVLFLAGYCRIRMDAGSQDRCASAFLESARFGSEAIESIRTVSSLSLEGKVVERYGGRLRKAVVTSTKRTMVSMIFFALSDCMDFLAIALVFWYGGQLVSNGKLSVQDFFIVYMAVIFGGQGAGFIFGYSSSITKAHAAINRMLYMQSQKPRLNYPLGKNTEPDSSSSRPVISFHKVHFRYPTRHDVEVLKGISFEVNKGENVCVVGPSGSGKSTIISLLEHFYIPNPGHILINGTDISTLNMEKYRATIGLVSQETHLYQDSIKDNLLLGLEREINEQDLIEICKEANIHEFISSLPEGYNTDIGPRGLSLSGGQRQRIALARALLRNPDVLLLDEAMSALDPESQSLVMEALERAGKGRTIVSVTHQMEVVRRADRVLVLENGRIVESGTYEELVGLKGRFWEMAGELMGDS